jgi:hypothetical protein
MPEQAQRVDRGIALLFRDLGARRGWVVSIAPRPLYPRERPGTHCTGDWVGTRAGLDVCEKSRHHRDFFFRQSIRTSFILQYILIYTPLHCCLLGIRRNEFFEKKRQLLSHPFDRCHNPLLSMLGLVLMPICNIKFIFYPFKQQKVCKFYTTTIIPRLWNFIVCAGVIHRSEFEFYYHVT